MNYILVQQGIFKNLSRSNKVNIKYISIKQGKYEIYIGQTRNIRNTHTHMYLCETAAKLNVCGS